MAAFAPEPAATRTGLKAPLKPERQPGVKDQAEVVVAVKGAERSTFELAVAQREVRLLPEGAPEPVLLGMSPTVKTLLPPSAVRVPQVLLPRGAHNNHIVPPTRRRDNAGRNLRRLQTQADLTWEPLAWDGSVDLRAHQGAFKRGWQYE